MIAFLGEHGAELALGLTVVLAAGALAVGLSGSPLHRHRLAELTLLVAVCAGALLAIPLPRPAAQWIAVAPGASPAPTPPQAETVGTWEPIPLATERAPRRSEVSPTPALTTETTVFESSDAEPATPLSHLVAQLFLAGAGLLAAYLTTALLLLRRTLRRATPAPAWIGSLATEVAGASTPRVLVSASDVRPFCCGLGKGTVVLPAYLAQPALATRVEAVLRHEHAHLVQRHPRGRLLAALAAPLLYWHPLYWWLAREQRNSAELLADDMAVGDFDKRRYVEELLELAEAARRALVPQVSRLGVLGSRQDFLERMESLLMRRNRLATRSSAQHVTTRSLAACLLLAGVSVSWGLPPQDENLGPSTVEDPVTVGYSLDESRRFGRLVLETTAPAARHDERLRASFEIQGAAALGQLMLRCADNSIDIGAFDVLTPEIEGHRTCTLELSGASVERLADIASSIEGVDLMAVKSWRPSPSRGTQSGGAPSAGASSPRSGGPGAGPARTDVSQQIARLAEQVDRLTQQYADMQATHGLLLTAFGATAQKPEAPSALETLAALGYVSEEPVTGNVVAVHNSREPFYIDSRGEHTRLVTIGCGENQGVTDKEVFEIYRGNTYKGRVRVVRVLDDSSWGVVLLEVEGQSIEAGDSATTDL